MKLIHIKFSGIHDLAREYDLTSKQFFVGDNGSGKSTILQAIQWALLGYIPGTNKTNAALMEHACGPTMMVSLDVDVDGTLVNIFRQLTKVGATVTAVNQVTPEHMQAAIEAEIAQLELPIFNFTEFTSMSSNKLKDWFLGYLPSSSIELNWAQIVADTLAESCISLSPDDEQQLVDVLAKSSEGLTGIDALRAANAAIKANISAHTAESKRVANTLQTLVRADTQFDLFALRAQLSECRENYKLAVDYNVVIDANAAAEKQLTQLSQVADLGDECQSDLKYIAAVQNLDAQREAIRKAEERRIELKREYESLLVERTMQQRTLNLGGVCPYTSTQCASIVDQMPELQRKLDDTVAKCASLKVEIELIDKDVQVAQNAIEATQRTIEYIQNRYITRDQLRRSLRPVPDVTALGEHTDPEYWQNKIDEINRNIGAAENNALADALVEQKMRLDTLLTAFKALDKITGVNGLQAQVGSPFERLICDMTHDIKALFGSDTTPAVVSAGKNNSFSFGISRRDNYIPYNMLSSGEKAKYGLTLVVALLRYSSKCKVLLVDDMFDHIDSRNLELINRWIFGLSDIQCIFAGVSPLESINPIVVR